MIEQSKLKKLIQVASGAIKADLVIKNSKVIDVFSGEIIEGDIAICDEKIAGIGTYEGFEAFDAKGRYAAPGFIDSHIHIESSCISPEELGKMLVPHGTTTIIADPHEIANVCGIDGLNYMMEAAKGTSLSIKFMLPSCVPATPFEHSGAVIDAKKMKEPILRDEILGLGEFMNFPGVISAEESVLDKLLVAKKANKLIDGHAPGVNGLALNAYIAAGIGGDHECSSVEDMREKLSRGMYIFMREGSACHDLRTLLKGVTKENSRRCLLCSDDRQPRTILSEGHLDNHLRICVEEGLDAITAIRMATLNAAECFRLYDRGAIAPGYRADIVLLDDLTGFNVHKVWINGKLSAEQGTYCGTYKKYPIDAVKNSIHLKDFSKEKLKMKLGSNKVNVIEIIPGGVLTKKSQMTVQLDENDCFTFNQDIDVVKIAVVERHQMTGNVACGLLKGYGLKEGAIAVSIAHDSHNIIVVGTNDEEMEMAVLALQEQNGGIVLIKDQKVYERMPMPIAGLMSDQSGEWVDKKLETIHKKACLDLKVSDAIEPIMTLCFMSLPVIPEVKLTDMGLFDVNQFCFIPIEAE